MPGFFLNYFRQLFEGAERRQERVWEYVSGERRKPPPPGKSWKCPVCRGAGVLDTGDVCPQCHGHGSIRE